MANTVSPDETDIAVEQKTPRVGPNGVRCGFAALTCALAGLLAQFPLLRNSLAYYTDDAAIQVLPMWFRLGEQVRGGSWPVTLDVGSWMGGNLVLEALFGVWNPVNALVWVFVSVMPDLALAGDVVRSAAFSAIALGSYLLFREYGARPWAASVTAAALPFCGSLFFFDAVKWPAALLAFVWIPYLWWATRRMAKGKGNAVWVFVLGVLAVTAGNPYGMLGVCGVLFAVLIETAVNRRWRVTGEVFLASAAIVAVAPLVYLPLLLSSHVTWRSTGGAPRNTGELTPNLSDLVNASLPGYVPEIPNVGDSAVFFCWFAIPLAAWFDWSVVRRRRRELAGCLVFTGIFLLMAIGPSDLWLFRWPLRLLHYGYLGLGVLLAVLLSAGLRTDHLRRRTMVATALLLFCYYLGWAANPDPSILRRQVLTVLGLAVLSGTAVWAFRRLGTRGLAAVVHAGTVGTFALQVHWFVDGHTPPPYYYPTNIAEARAHFAHRYQGAVFQISDLGGIGPPRPGPEAWHDLMPGNFYQATGIESINAYTGMGFSALSNTVCLSYNGSACADAYSALWQRVPGTEAPLANLLRVDTVVVQRRLIPEPVVPAGWHVVQRTDRITVLERTVAAPRTSGRLSWASPNVRVTANTALDNRHETATFSRSDGRGGQLLFARLAWPGYTAKMGNRQLPAHAGPAGLLQVDIPADAPNSSDIRISWSPPGIRIALICAALGALTTTALAAAQAHQHRHGALRRASR
ncbi:hypothetical protein [Saccharopolyspora hattusasensis]|uniref:hypothetical protein n=1 Tax=Saccharopolyspora hattusasensis TaxID=1128679 RepID=UPI003D999689